MTALYRIWDMKWEEEYDRLRGKSVEDEKFDVTGDELLSDLRSWEWFADKNYIAGMPKAAAGLLTLAVVVGVATISRICL